MSSILVVEDDMIVRELLFDLLSEKHACHVAESAEEAIERLNSEHFDVVLTDISMPGMSGLELLGQVRQRWPDTTVIIISGIRDQEYAQGLLKMGAFDYLVKPFDLEAVKQSVACAIEQHRKVLESREADEAEDVPEVEKRVDEAAVFSSLQLDKVFSLFELMAMVQRGSMNGYVQLRWDEATIEEARRTGKFVTADGEFDEAVQHSSGCIHLRDGLIIDATIGESESSYYWREAEEALIMLVRLATWASVGMRAWGFASSDLTRPVKLSVADNSGKLFSIITSDEEDEDEPELKQPAAEDDHEQAAAEAAPVGDSFTDPKESEVAFVVFQS